MTRSRCEIDLRPPCYRDVKFLAENMREQDRREIFATQFHESPSLYARDCMAACQAAITAYTVWPAGAERPAAFIGVVWMTPAAAFAFMFGTGEIRRIAAPLSFYIRERMIPNLKFAGLRRVETRSLKANRTACRWLRWLGAAEEAELPGFGKRGETFIQFAWRNTDELSVRKTASRYLNGRRAGPAAARAHA